jgi:DNA repair ATPase RecN
MKTDGTPETEFEEAMPLFAKILETNARNLQWTNDQILANKEAQLREMQQNYVKLYAALHKVAERTDSATAYDALDRFWHVNEDAKKELAKPYEQY